MSRNPVTEWLESREGEEWSREHHRHAHAGEAYLPNHIASVRPTPGRDPVWDREPSGRGFWHNPEHDPSGRVPLARAPSRYVANELLRARVQTEAAAINAREGMASVPARTPQSRTTRGRSR